MHLYFERIPLEHRFTDMTDQDNQQLIESWNRSWNEAGWNTRILTVENAKQHPFYNQLEIELKQLRLDDFAKIQFRKYLAMATMPGGGWLSDYDLFPLQHDFRQLQLPNKGEFTLCDTVVPDLAVANEQNWLLILKALLNDAHNVLQRDDALSQRKLLPQRQNDMNYWTDSLGMYSLMRNESIPIHSSRDVMAGSTIMLEEWSAMENNHNKSNVDVICQRRPIRKKRNAYAVHFSPRDILRGTGVEARYRFSKYRARIAQEMIGKYLKHCFSDQTERIEAQH